MHSLVGLTRNHLNVIGQGCPGGLPEEHKVAILAAAKHLTSGEQAVTAAQSACTPPRASTQPNLAAAADQQAAALQAPPRNGTNRLASHALDSSISSCTSFASDNESDTSLDASRGSIARQALQQAPSRLASGPDRPAPSQSQLQALYSELEADYRRLQDRSAQSRASSHPPLQAGTAQAPASGMSAVAAPNRQGKRPPPTFASPPAKGKVSAVSLLGPAPILVAAGIPPSAAGLQQAKAPAPGKANRSSQHSKLVTGRFPSAADHEVSGGEGGLQRAGDRLSGVAANQGGESKASGSEVQRVTAAAAVRQMRKQKRALPEEPFVQVFTNFHTLSKVTNMLFVENSAASVHWMSVTLEHLAVQQPA